jgi:hypothetical protein
MTHVRSDIGAGDQVATDCRGRCLTRFSMLGYRLWSLTSRLCAAKSSRLPLRTQNRSSGSGGGPARRAGSRSRHQSLPDGALLAVHSMPRGSSSSWPIVLGTRPNCGEIDKDVLQGHSQGESQSMNRLKNVVYIQA